MTIKSCWRWNNGGGDAVGGAGMVRCRNRACNAVVAWRRQDVHAILFVHSPHSLRNERLRAWASGRFSSAAKAG